MLGGAKSFRTSARKYKVFWNGELGRCVGVVGLRSMWQHGTIRVLREPPHHYTGVGLLPLFGHALYVCY